MEENNGKICTEIKNFIDWVGTLQTVWWIVGTCILLIVFIACVVLFTKRVNGATKVQISRFEKEGKYLPALYIELNNTMEFLRYFLFSFKWKRRLIKQYNHLFVGYEGKRLKKYLGNDTKCRLSCFSSFKKFVSTLSDMHERLDALKKQEKKLHEKYGEVIWAVRNNTYNHIYGIERYQELCDMMQRKNIVLVGSAGNGKTSLVCRMAELAAANGIPCLLVNSRDIKEDCTNYVINRLPIFPKLKKWSGIYLRLVSFLLAIRRKYFYIFIDAINENDREVFTGSIAGLLNFFSKYSRIRILLTCRSEYFEARYQKLFFDANEKPYVFTLSEAQYDDRAIKKLIKAYMSHYNVSGPFSPEMQEKLKNSLFLTRIFFEVNSNHDDCLLEFRNAEIYKLYFEKVASENPGINLGLIVSIVSARMFANWRFDSVPMDELHLSTEDTDSLRSLMDNNLIISHSIRAGKGITAREEECVYFVFDEFRDFCLARYLLVLDEKNKSKQYKRFFLNAYHLYEQRLSPVEGILKYAYHFFRVDNKDDLCQQILDDFGEKDVQSILDWEQCYHLRRNRTFDNFGFSIIMSEGDNIAHFEFDYILRCIEKTPESYWEVFWFLLRNEYWNYHPGIDFAINLLARCNNEEVIEEILHYFFKDRAERYYSYRDDKCNADVLAEWIDEAIKRNGGISESFKMFIIILSAYDPTDFALREYHEFVMDKGIFEKIQTSTLSQCIKTSVNELRESMLPQQTDQNALRLLMKILKSEGYSE